MMQFGIAEDRFTDPLWKMLHPKKGERAGHF